jgi:metallo-beta-lactamase family protein
MIARLIKEGRIPDVPIYLNSPMAISVTDIFVRHAEHHRLTETECREMCEGVVFTNDVEASKKLNHLEEPAVIISASGMATGGRVVHHLKSYAPEAKNTILFAGFQAAGTRGEAMLAGAESIKIHGEYIPVRAEVVELNGLSAHADYVEIGDWLESVDQPPERVFLTHGEPSAADAMRRYLRDRFGWDCELPELEETVELG